MRWLFVAVFLLAGCGASARDAMRVALNTIASSVDPAYSPAVVACDSREAYVEATITTRAEYEAQIATVRADCDRAFAAFEAVREAHAAASEMFENGVDLATIFGAFERLQAAWASLREVWR